MLGDCASITTCVTIDSRSDPTSSRCQISVSYHAPARGLSAHERTRNCFHGRALISKSAISKGVISKSVISKSVEELDDELRFDCFEEDCFDKMIARDLDWWSQTGSNRRPPACKAGALPTELWPPQGSVIRDQVSGQKVAVPDSRYLITDPGIGGPGKI
jgi:hypothetical protein